MFAVVRVRGRVGVRKEIEDTMRMLRLKAPNHCVLVPETSSYLGMLQKCKDFCTWGEINEETLVELLKYRLKKRNGEKVKEEELEELTGCKTFEELAKKLMSGEVKLKEFKRISPVFRLRPPKKGYKSIKLHWPKGDLGYRGDKINELLRRMI